MPGIDKVRLDNSYQQYQQRMPVKRSEEAKPQFPFDPDEKGVIYERSKPQEKAAESDAERTVRIEVEKKEDTKPRPETVTAGTKESQGESTLTGWIAGLGRRFLTFLRGIWDVVWNGPDQTAKTETGEESGEAEESAAAGKAEEMQQAAVRTSEEAQTSSGPTSEEALQQIIANRDMEQLVQFVTEGGAKKPARSTDLLTIYNRYGRVNYVDPSDRRKILEGNFNDIKL